MQVIQLKILIQHQTIILKTYQNKQIKDILNYLQEQKIILCSQDSLILRDSLGQILRPERIIQKVIRPQGSDIRQIHITINQSLMPTNQRPTNQQYISHQALFVKICKCILSNQQNQLKQMLNQAAIDSKMYRLFQRMGLKMAQLQAQNMKQYKNGRQKLINQNKILQQQLKIKQKEIKIANQIIGKIISQQQKQKQKQKQKDKLQIQKFNSVLSKPTIDTLVNLQQFVCKKEESLTKDNFYARENYQIIVNQAQVVDQQDSSPKQ